MTFELRRCLPLLAFAAVSAAPLGAPALAQSTASASADAEPRLRRIEAEIRAIQRKVFPDGAGKTFAPEITPSQTTTTPRVGTPASSAVTDVLARMDAVEAQMARLTAQVEEGQNRAAKIEERLARLEAQATPSEPAAAPTTAAAPVVTAPTAPKPTTATTTAPKPATTPAAKPATPSAARVAAVQAIEKPSTADAGLDEYNYGYRLWEAKFFPEAQQQLQHFVQTYPKHKRISYARNLLGRAYLDDNKPGTAAQWFVQNYLGDKQGDRAADSLLYLGVAMTRLKETKRACTAFSEFKTTYPAETTGRLKAQYEAASKAVTCN